MNERMMQGAALILALRTLACDGGHTTGGSGGDGGGPWPSIGPDVSGYVNEIPAKARFHVLTGK